MSEANKIQIGGEHYKTDGNAPEHWDLAKLYQWEYKQAVAIKYLMRFRKKNGAQDLEKALHYIIKLLEDEYGTVIELLYPMNEMAKKDASATNKRNARAAGVRAPRQLAALPARPIEAIAREASFAKRSAAQRKAWRKRKRQAR